MKDTGLTPELIAEFKQLEFEALKNASLADVAELRKSTEKLEGEVLKLKGVQKIFEHVIIISLIMCIILALSKLYIISGIIFITTIIVVFTKYRTIVSNVYHSRCWVQSMRNDIELYFKINGK